MFSKHRTSLQRTPTAAARPLGQMTGWMTLVMALTLTLPLATRLDAAETDDTRIARGVRAAFASHPALNDEQITVVVYDRIVELSGFVDRRDERAVADTLAMTMTIDGVRAVDNRLERHSTPSRFTAEPKGDTQ